MDVPIYNVPVPYAASIQGGFGPGRMLKLQGTVHPTAKCFAVNLQCGPSVNPRDDIALHLSPVFMAPPRVVRNSLQAQCWGPEESHGVYFPFVAGQPYEILILSENDHLKIAINGQHFAEFHHRIPVQRVTFLAIDGETTISMIQFSGTTRAPSPSFAAAYGQPAYGGFPAPPPATSPYGAPPVSSPYGAPPVASPYGAPPVASPYGMAPSPYPQVAASPYGAPGYPTAYPHSPSSQHKSGLGGLGAVLGGAGLGAAAGSLLTGRGHHSSHHKSGVGSLLGAGGLGAAAGSLLGAGHHKHHKHSKAIPIGLGVGAAALGGAALLGHNPLKPKKLKKLYKHKHFKHKHKHKFGFHGFGSSSSSD